ncbi:putative protein kinase RLK-Pelle-SD-2b family [Helianthus anomalus]
MFSRDPLHAYYINVTVDPSNATNSGDQLIFDATGYMYILRGNDKIFDLTPRDKLHIGDYYHGATLDSDGVFTQYYHPKNSTDNTRWEAIRFMPENICNRLKETIGSGACGLNNVCSLADNHPKCECPPRFSFLDSNDPNGDCIPDFTPICDKGYQGDLFDFTELTDIDWPDYANINPTTEEKCKRSFLEDCFCVVATYTDRQCWKKTHPLFNGMKNSSLNMKAFLKFRKGDGPLQSPHGFSETNKNQRSLISVGPVLLSAYVFLIFVLLVKATNGFKVELGKGAFGIVYKGVVGTNMVAVKKLDRVLQDGEKEFHTEVIAIARTHHKNLVQLLGYCDEGEQRILVYEYMSNGTLASFLFLEERPSWNQRSNIALDIAKAISYLHEGCRTQIIHCDTNTGIRGTKRYVAPEWFRNTPVTVKVDVYNYGVLLLEIISCRKSVKKDNESSDEYGVILTNWAWDCYQEKTLDAFVNNDSEALDDYKKLTKFMMVGLWCVQENPSLRPSMRKVIQMLEGVIEISKPPCPFAFSVILNRAF